MLSFHAACEIVTRVDTKFLKYFIDHAAAIEYQMSSNCNLYVYSCLSADGRMFNTFFIGLKHLQFDDTSLLLSTCTWFQIVT